MMDGAIHCVSVSSIAALDTRDKSRRYGYLPANALVNPKAYAGGLKAAPYSPSQGRAHPLFVGARPAAASTRFSLPGVSRARGGKPPGLQWSRPAYRVA